MSVSCEGCEVYTSSSWESLVQSSPTECGVSECDREASTVRRRWPTRAVQPGKRSILKSMKRFIMLFASSPCHFLLLGVDIHTIIQISQSIHVFYNYVKQLSHKK
jgi:hypothetical protein